MASHSSILPWRIPWTVYRVTKGWTWLKGLSTHARTHAGERRVSITIWRAEKGLGRAGTREWGRGQSSGAGLEKRSRRKAGSHLVGLRSGMEI